MSPPATAMRLLAAAHCFADVTSTDYVPALLDKGRARAAAEGLQVKFQIADAEDLPFANGTFDVALSTFGAMFTPDHTRPAREMLRVVRNGGRIGLANWTPEGFIGQLFKVIGAYVPPPAGLKSPALWGTEPHLVELFGAQAADIRTVRKFFKFRYRSSAHWIQVFRDFYGPTHKAFAALDAAGQQALEKDITALLNRCNTAGEASLVVPGEYLEVVVTKRGG
jgi:ubiquinone/menaquinone biosynthesis C-methylase UbiE